MRKKPKNERLARRAGRPAKPIPKDKLLSIARAVFAESGYAGASLNEIARRANLRKASLFHHFPSKEILYREVVGELIGDLGRLVEDARLDRGSFRQRLDRLGELVIQYLGDRRNTARLLLREVLDEGPFMRGEGKRAIQSTLEMIAAFLQSGMDEGVIARQDPRHLAISITGLHLLYFVAGDVSSRFLGKDIFSSGMLEMRKRELISQVTKLCGVE
jgi:TetR/AcrR family transcriptional regulator